MSVDAGAFVTVTMAEGSSALVILHALIATGWAFDDSGNLSYLPLGDEDYEWTTRGAEELDMVMQELGKKADAGETIGVVLTQNGIGGNFLIFPSGELVFTPSVFRQQLPDGYSDVSWYLLRLLPSLSKIPGGTVSAWSWKETG